MIKYYSSSLLLFNNNCLFWCFQVLYELRAHNSDAMSLYNDLQNPQGNFTVFVPVNSAVTAQVRITFKYSL